MCPCRPCTSADNDAFCLREGAFVWRRECQGRGQSRFARGFGQSGDASANFAALTLVRSDRSNPESRPHDAERRGDGTSSWRRAEGKSKVSSVVADQRKEILEVLLARKKGIRRPEALTVIGVWGGRGGCRGMRLISGRTPGWFGYYQRPWIFRHCTKCFITRRGIPSECGQSFPMAAGEAPTRTLSRGVAGEFIVSVVIQGFYVLRARKFGHHKKSVSRAVCHS